MKDKKPKQLRVTVSRVVIEPNYTDVHLTYGRSLGLGTVRLHSEDFADFLEGLRLGFKDIVVTQAKSKTEKE